MFARLLLLFILMPFLELWLLTMFAERFGIIGTVLMVVGTGMLGATLAKRQGLRVWLDIHKQTQQGQVPAAAMVDAFMIFIAGVLLITPGLITDMLGLLLLIPIVRAGIRQRANEWFRKQTVVQVRTFGQSFETHSADGTVHREDIIDVEVEHSAEQSQRSDIPRLENPGSESKPG